MTEKGFVGTTASKTLPTLAVVAFACSITAFTPRILKCFSFEGATLPIPDAGIHWPSTSHSTRSVDDASSASDST